MICAAKMYAQTPAMKDLSWILGQWQIKGEGYTVYENWKKGDGGSYAGEAFVLEGKDTIVREIIKIEMIGEKMVYIAQVNDGNPVLFTLKAGSTVNELVFENMEHDNPQRVVYQHKSKDAMYAYTEATIEGETLKDEYNYTRR